MMNDLQQQRDDFRGVASLEPDLNTEKVGPPPVGEIDTSGNPLAAHLQKLGACPEGLVWVVNSGFPTLEEAWRACRLRGDWMAWILYPNYGEGVYPDPLELVRLLVDIVRRGETWTGELLSHQFTGDTLEAFRLIEYEAMTGRKKWDWDRFRGLDLGPRGAGLPGVGRFFFLNAVAEYLSSGHDIEEGRPDVIDLTASISYMGHPEAGETYSTTYIAQLLHEFVPIDRIRRWDRRNLGVA